MPERFSWIIENSIAGMERPGLHAELSQDLAFLRNRGIDVIVNLQEREHFVSHDGFIMKNIPIDDFGPPCYEDFVEFIEFATSHIRQNRRILVHCFAGMGRTNIMLAAYLLHYRQINPDEALREVSMKRPYHVVTYKQEEALWTYYFAVREALSEGF